MMKTLRNFIVIALVIGVFCTFVSCGEKKIAGTWVIDYIEYDGSKFTIEEWKNTEDEDLSGYYIILKEGGKAYLYDGDYGYLADWLQSEDKLMIDGNACTFDDGKICIDYYDNKIFLKKQSDNQTIPNDEEKEEIKDGVDEEDENIDEEIDATTDVSWREFLKEYEEWIDEYIKILNKYNENPTDLSILEDYADMMVEMAEWSERADEIELEIEDPVEAAEYTSEMLKIVAKLTNAIN